MGRPGKPENYDGELDDAVSDAREDVRRMLRLGGFDLEGADRAMEAIHTLIEAMITRAAVEGEK